LTAIQTLALVAMLSTAPSTSPQLVRVEPMEPRSPSPGESRTPMCMDCEEYGDCPLPPELEASLGPPPWDNEDVCAAQARYRVQHAEVYGSTEPPPGPLRLPGEFEPAEALYLAYTAIDAYDGLFGDLLNTVSEQGPVRVLHLPGARKRLETRLWLHGLTWSEIQRVHTVPFESIWVRDFGPIAVHSPQGVTWIDTRYVGDCLMDDALPTRLAASRPATRVHRAPLRLDGGNLLSDGRGTCFMAAGVAARNKIAPHELAAQMQAWFGCERLVILHPLSGNVIEHVDMFLHVADHDLLLLGEYEPGEHPENERRLDANFATLSALRTPEGDPYRIVRVPMPPPLEPIDEEAAPPLRSHLNLVVFNGAVMVPTYGDDPRREAEVLAIIRGAYPDREVSAVDSSRIAEDLGALHCVTFTVPRIEPPAEF
jgi:agmatine/peptidylarginine deiminase